MSYLKNLTTGEVYPTNEHLLRRGDFVAVESLDAPAPVVEEVTLDVPAPKAKRAPRKKEAPVVEETPEASDETVPEVDLGDIDFSDINLGVE